MPKVLLIDDEPRILRSLTAALEQDHDIYTSGSAHDAKAVIKAGGKFDAIISDQIMPEMKGHELLNWCRLKSPMSKRIMLTGAPITDELKQQIKGIENVRIFRKPWNIEEINALLNSIPNASASASKNSQGDVAQASYKVLVFEPSERYQTLCSGLAPTYADRVIHCDTRQQLLHRAVEHKDATQIIVSLHDGTNDELDFLAQLHEACPKAKILITAEPRTIRVLMHLKPQATYLTVLSKPFSIKGLVNMVAAKR